MRQFINHHTIELYTYKWRVFRWDSHPPGSAGAGRAIKVCVEAYESLGEAQAAFPDAIVNEAWPYPDANPGAADLSIFP